MKPAASPRLTAAQAALWREAAVIFRRHANEIIAAAHAAGYEPPQVVALLATPFVGVLRDCFAGALPKGAEARTLDLATWGALEKACEMLASTEILEAQEALRH